MNRQDNEESWRERGRNNLIRQQLEIADEATATVVTKKTVAVAIVGPAGVGKTHRATAVARKLGVNPRISSPNSKVGLLDEVYRAGTGTLFFDDADSIINAAMINDLKKLFNPNFADRWLVNNIKGKANSHEKDHTNGKAFSARCGIVMLSNKNLNIPNQWPKSTHSHLAAITSRIPVYAISDDILTMWEYTCFLAICDNLLGKKKYSLVVANQALEYMTETIWTAGDASPRRLEQIAKAISMHPRTWRKVLDLRLPPATKSRTGSIPPIPQIIRDIKEKTTQATDYAGSEDAPPGASITSDEIIASN